MRAKGPLGFLTDWGRYDMADTEKWTVLEARRLGLSWEQIAQALDRSRQSVWERWHADDDEVDPASGDLSENYGFAYIGVPVTAHFSGSGDREKYVVKRLRRLRTESRRRDEVVPRLVDQARSEGATWSDVGQALGVSRQAAWKKWR